MKTSDFLRQHDACPDDAKWALSVSYDMADLWDAMVDQGKHEWLVWMATRTGVFPDAALRRLACRFVRETPLMDGRTVWDLLTDERSRKAVEVADAYIDGNVTDAELDAAYAAARDAAYDARAAACAASYDAAARAAYCAAGAAESARAARAAVCAVHAVGYAARAAYDAARSAQVQMIAELGNPFKEGKTE